MSNLEALTIATKTYMKRQRFTWHSSLIGVQLEDFQHVKERYAMSAKLMGTTDGIEWFFVPIEIDGMDILYWEPSAVYKEIDKKLKQAVIELNEMADDPFLFWVKKVREEASVQ